MSSPTTTTSVNQDKDGNIGIAMNSQSGAVRRVPFLAANLNVDENGNIGIFGKSVAGLPDLSEIIALIDAKIAEALGGIPPKETFPTHIEKTIKKYDLEDKHAITYHIFDTGVPGINTAIIGGVHGNEIAGWNTALQFANEFNFKTGKFLIIPKANLLACELNDRYPGYLVYTVAH